MSELLSRELRDKWGNVCASYQSMKEGCLALLEHPESTEEQMMEAAVALRDARKRMESARVRLAELYPRYTFSLKGVSVQIHRTHINLTTTN